MRVHSTAVRTIDGVVLRPVEAKLDPAGELRLVLKVRHRHKGDGNPRTRRPGRAGRPTGP